MNQKGFTYVELLMAICLSVLVVTAVAFVAKSAVSQPVASAEFISTRVGMEEVAADLSTAAMNSERAFSVAGILLSGGSPWQGGPLAAVTPLSDALPTEDFLAANGLTATPSAGASSLALIDGEGRATVLLIERQVSPRGLVYRVTLHQARGTKIVEYEAPSATLSRPDQPAPGITRTGDVFTVLLPNSANSDPYCAPRAVPITVLVPVVGR